jgi:hypothetical protein
MLRNIPKHHFGSNGLESMLHNFGTPEILHSGPKHDFFFFDAPTVSELLRNTPKHHFESNGLEWMFHDFGTPKYCIQARNMSFPYFYMLKVSEII